MSGIIADNSGRSSGVIATTAAADPTYVQFPATQVASADANRLDDYEEGTFSVALGCGSGTATLNGSYDTAGYIKVGRIVHIAGFFALSAISSPSGALTITGLPFTVGGVSEDGDSSCIPLYINSTLTSGPIPGGVTGYTYASISYIKCIRGGADTSTTVADFLHASTYMGIGGSFIASA